MDIKIESLLNDSNNIFLIDEKNGHQYTYKELHDSACAMGGFLISLGLSKGDYLAIMMDNSVMMANIYFACLYAGIVVIPINPAWSKDQVNFVLSDSKANYLITTSNYCKNIQSETIHQIIISDEENVSSDFYNFKTIQNHTKINSKEYLNPENIAIIIYTSGTTSQPKGVIHTVGNLIGNGSYFVKTMGMTEKHRFYNFLPMTYLGGYYNLMLIPYLAGGSVVITDPFNTKTILRFWENVIKNQVNALWLVPTVMAILMEIDRSKIAAEYTKKHITLALVGTAPLPLKLKSDFETKYGLAINENYGLTETLFISTHLPNASLKGVGKPLNVLNIRIINEEGIELKQGEEGEIEVSTPFAMSGYLGNEELFKKNTGQWFQTGDLGYLDADGSLHITGRKKDMIIKGGINISPAAIENVIYRHHAVQECAVVGIPHALSGEEIVAIVKTKDDVDFQDIKKQIKDICCESLSVIQCPADIIKLDELPHTFTGKIQKAKLRAWLVENKNPQHSIQNESKITPIKETNYFQPSLVVGNAIPALSIAYNTMVYDLQNKNIDATVLSLGEAFFDIPLFDFTKLPYPASYHYSHSRGVPKLRQVLAEYFQKQYDVKFNPEKEIIITAGSKIAIYMTLMAVINPGDEVIIHDPAWVSYPEQVKLCHGVPVQVPYYESIYDFEKYITNRTKMLIVNNPNNPRGSVLTLDEIAYLYKLAERYKLYILSDEAYSDFVVNKEQFISIGNFDKDLKFSIICNSISKNFGISGWRIGYVIANNFLIDQILKLNQHLITCPATILEHYIAEHFYDILKFTKPQILELMHKRKKIVDYIEAIGLSCLEGSTTFYIFLSLGETSLSSDEFCMKLLNEHRICIVPGIGYGNSCDKFARVSIGTEPLEKIYSALQTIKKLIDSTKTNNLLTLAKSSETILAHAKS